MKVNNRYFSDFCWKRQLTSSRDYVDYFIQWYCKRQKHYVNDKTLINIMNRIYNNVGRGMTRYSPVKPYRLNERFGVYADGDFCRVSLYKVIPMNGELCIYCSAPLTSFVTTIKDGYELSEYNVRRMPQCKHFPDINGKGLSIFQRSINIYDLQMISHQQEPVNTYNGVCENKQCKELNKWKPKKVKIKNTYVYALKPSLKTINKQTSKYRKSFVAARYLDFNARLKIASQSGGGEWLE